ncbi:putative cell wall-associated protein precursor [Kordia algicida OT-1]|uniref:Putative cell wall-associated protein n=2 Tax=Kordia TaxID=221065 RepID=A9DNX5_9FLAO|nr:putative cell wall-associated protein precursor [Kordia algicida OT-1]
MNTIIKTMTKMKKLLYIFSVVVPMLVMGQTTSENYTKTTVYQNQTQNGNIPENQKLESITYFDGLGRPFQKISVKAGGGQQDIVVPIVYDQYGRMTKEYLPYATSSQNGNIHANSINNQATFYNTEKYENTLNPFAETVYDNSPLSRPLKQGAPGNSWAINPNSDNDHAVKFEYQVNTFEEGNIAKDNVMRFGVSHPNNDTEQTQLEFINYYGEGTLQKKIVKDENWTSNQPFLKDHTTEEYVDKLGRVVLKRNFNKNKKHDTYYVYDKFENLTYVIPPKASDDIVVTTTTQTGLLSGQNFSWVDLVLVDKELAEQYQKKLSQYKNEDILTADLENKYGAQGGFSISRNTDTNELILNINFSTNEPLPFKTGEIVSLKDLGEFKDTELGVIKTDDYDYTFLVKNNTLFIQGEGKLLALNQSFSSNTKLNYSKNFSWVSILDVDTKFANTYLSQLKPYPNDEILNVTIENQYGGSGGMHIAVDQNDVVSLHMNINTTTPLAFREGLVIDLGLKRRIADVTLGTFSAEGFTYEFSIKENALHISGSGTITSAFPIFTGTQPSTTTNYSIAPEVLQGLCYIYHYDNRNRVVEKKIPGKGWEYIVYDRLNRPALLQDAKLRLDDKWFVTQYDALNRPVMTGLYWKEGNSWTRRQMQEAVDNSQNLNAFRVATPINNNNHYYDGFAFPGIKEIHSINYYEDYSFNESSLTLPSNSQIYGVQISSDTKTLPTGTKIRILGTDQWITTITHYDQKGRPIYVASKNEYLSSFDITETKLDFTGKVLESKLVHTKNGNTPIITIDRFTYDSSGRLLTQKQQINDQEEELIVANTYDELGILESKKVGNTEVNPLQEIDYSYTIRGWLKAINDVNTNDVNKLFSFKINYDNPDLNQTTHLFNGNISETHWKTANDMNLRSYSYNYDALNRVTSAMYQSGQTLSSLANNDIENYSLNNVSYDKSGNILSLERMGITQVANPTVDIIDQLTYNYASNSNTLVKVTDVADNAGFKDVNTSENDYMYDVNGNMTSDINKGIIPNGITYNHLNLPTTINFGDQGSISYIYDATGIKMAKIVQENNSFVKTQYAGNFIYKVDNTNAESLVFFNHPEGYIEPTNSNTFSYTFQFKDHLGNIRLSYQDFDDNGVIDSNTEIKEESNYYPFGLKHKGYNNIITGRNHNYGFGGKEENDELGLEWLDFHARNYNASLGRWMNIDPLSEKFYSYSTYNAMMNDPINYIDPDGMKAKWIPKLNENGEITYISEKGDSASTLSSQYGISQKDAEKITGTTGDSKIDEGTEVSGSKVEQVTGNKILKLDISSKEGKSDQRRFDQFLFAVDVTRYNGDYAFKPSTFFKSKIGMSSALSTTWGGVDNMAGRAYFSYNNKKYSIYFKIPMIRSVANSSSTLLGTEVYNSKQRFTKEMGRYSDIQIIGLFANNANRGKIWGGFEMIMRNGEGYAISKRLTKFEIKK